MGSADTPCNRGYPMNAARWPALWRCWAARTGQAAPRAAGLYDLTCGGCKTAVGASWYARGTGAGPAVARHDRLDGRKTAPARVQEIARNCNKPGRKNRGVFRTFATQKKSQRARSGLPFPRFPRPPKTPALLLALGLELGALGLFQPGQALA